MPSPFYDPHEEIELTTNDLPHWDQSGSYCFITWRMGDSLPKAKLDKWKYHRYHWLKDNPKPWGQLQQQTYKDLFHKTIDKWLDAGSGSCLLKHPPYRAILSEALHYRDQQGQCRLLAYVIMPNHVHVLLKLVHGAPLFRLVQNIKRRSARKINEARGAEGQFWQNEYYDTLIRSQRHLAFVQRYIENNPKNLPASHYTLWKREGDWEKD